MACSSLAEPMTIPKKGSRYLWVGGVEYAWRIRKKPTYAQGAFSSAMRLAVQCRSEANGPRSVLVVSLCVRRPDNWVAPHQTAVTPAVIRDIVERALAAGWAPTSGGTPFSFDYPLLRDDPSPPPKRHGKL